MPLQGQSLELPLTLSRLRTECLNTDNKNFLLVALLAKVIGLASQAENERTNMHAERENMHLMLIVLNIHRYKVKIQYIDDKRQ